MQQKTPTQGRVYAAQPSCSRQRTATFGNSALAEISCIVVVLLACRKEGEAHESELTVLRRHVQDVVRTSSRQGGGRQGLEVIVCQHYNYNGQHSANPLHCTRLPGSQLNCPPSARMCVCVLLCNNTESGVHERAHTTGVVWGQQESLSWVYMDAQATRVAGAMLLQRFVFQGQSNAEGRALRELIPAFCKGVRACVWGWGGTGGNEKDSTAPNNGGGARGASSASADDARVLTGRQRAPCMMQCP